MIKEVGGDSNDDIDGDPAQMSNKKIEIKGAVMVGWGLEPCSVGRFKMIEIEDMLEEEDADEEEEEDEDEYEEMSDEDVLENANSLNTIMGSGDPDIEEDSNPFDLPGAFE